MALPVLDGNQSATTLSSVVTGGEHIVAHSVVSLGTTAIANIASAVSGVNISGTVTANTAYAVSVTGNAGLAASTVTAIPVALVDRGVYGGNLLGYNGTNTYLNTAIESVGGNSLRSGGTFPVSGSVTIGNSVTISSLPAISGTVTANISTFPKPTWNNYSGSVVTANSAVTAISTITRSYLLAQVTTGQMFLNIGATCTTGNGVYFSAGQGFAWETSVPQGIVSIISSVTGTNYVLKDG